MLILGLSLVVQLVLWTWIGVGFRRVRDHNDALPDEAPPLPVSVIVAARNEANRLGPLLLRLTRQTHTGPLEVIVVDDASTDDTAALVRKEAERWAAPKRSLRLVSVTEGETEAAGLPRKKHAITRGVEAATHERLVVTDADGRPTRGWLASLLTATHSAAETRTENSRDDGAVLLGFGPYTKHPGWLNRLIRYETIHTALLASGAAAHGHAWHAVGRNLSYPASLFHRLGGFAAHADSLSGDDDLFIQHVARETDVPIRPVTDPRSFVVSEPPRTLSAFVRQRRRHASAGRFYAPSILLGLGLLHGTNLALWVGAPLLHMVSGVLYGYGLLAAKLLVQRISVGQALEAYHASGDLHLAQPPLDLLLSLYQVGAGVLGALPIPRRW